MIGELAAENLSYLGIVKNQKCVKEELVPAIVAAVQAQGADAAVLTPGLPGCHLTISKVARGLEEAGVSTVVVYLDIY